MQIIEKVENLLCVTFGCPRSGGTRDQAEYILSMTDPEDMREWMMAVFEADEIDPRIDRFMDQFAVLDSVQHDIPVMMNVLPSEKSDSPEVVKPYPTSVANNRQPDNPPVVRVYLPVPPSRKEIRSQCTCFAQHHQLLGNCLRCGRIVCEEEDYGDCLFCGADKDDPHQMHWSALSQGAEGSSRSSSSCKTHIYDRQTDWRREAENVWRGRQEREAAMHAAQEFEQKKLEAKHELKIALDFTSGSISLVDKSIGMQKADNDETNALHAFVNHQESCKHHHIPEDDRSHSLLTAIKEIHRGTSTPEKQPLKSPESQLPVSIFSFLDDDTT